MWSYIKPYLPQAVLAALFMAGEVLMDLFQPGIMSRIVDEGVLGIGEGGAGNLQVIWRLGLQMIGMVLLGGFCGSMNNVFVHMSSQNIGNRIRKDCFRSVMSLSFPQMDQFGAGSLTTRITNDVTQVENLAAQFVRGLVRTIMLTFGSMYCMFCLNRGFGLIVIGAFPLIAACIVICLRRANPLFERLQRQLDMVNGMMQEDISGIRIIKACVREAGERLRFEKANGQLAGTQRSILMIFAFMNPAVNMVMYLATAAILLTGARGAGGATPGTVMAAITYITQLLNGMLMLIMLFQSISRGFASWKRVKELLNSPPAMEEGSASGKQGRGEVVFRDVSFSYPGSSRRVLDHINLTVKPGETIAVMGATGCGKTTLIHMIPRFYDVTEGQVLVDGVDVRQYSLTELRQGISVVLQKSELFGISIRDAIRWGKPDASDEEIRAAAETAQASEFISALSEGYDTVASERGMGFSGGQRQRLSIARGVIKPAKLLIFDDATSALDLKTEAAFYEALKALRPDSTKIIVAQRIASVRRADRIVVMENGRIAACGTHRELLRSCPIYRDIYDSQMGGGETADG